MSEETGIDADLVELNRQELMDLVLEHRQKWDKLKAILVEEADEDNKKRYYYHGVCFAINKMVELEEKTEQIKKNVT